MNKSDNRGYHVHRERYQSLCASQRGKRRVMSASPHQLIEMLFDGANSASGARSPVL